MHDSPSLWDHRGIAATGAETAARVIEVERAVASPRDAVWARWTSSDGLAGWLLPDTHVELRIGGPYEFYFDPDSPAGQRGGEGNQILAFLAPRLLTFTWNAPTHLSTRTERTMVIVELDEVAGGTRVRLTHTGWPAAGLEDETSDWPDTFAYFERAWRLVLDALERDCGALSPAGSRPPG